MSNRSIGLSDQVYDYLVAHSLREPDLLRRLRDETARLTEFANMEPRPAPTRRLPPAIWITALILIVLLLLWLFGRGAAGH